MPILQYDFDDFKRDSKFIKQGGEASVYKAWHGNLGQKNLAIPPIELLFFSNVAIKKWTKRLVKEEIDLLTQVENIYKRTRRVTQEKKHSNIISCIGILIDSKKCTGYIMPYMENGSLEEGEIVSIKSFFQ